METYSPFMGVFIGLSAFLIIGLLHPVVIKGEFYFGTKICPVFLFLGIISLVATVLFIADILISSILGVLGFSLLWSIHELFEQKKRVEKGWFPKNLKKEARSFNK